MPETMWLERGRPTRPPAVIAHRGGAALGPENELATVRAAMAAGAVAVEVDVQELGDGSLVLAHNGYIQDGGWRWLRDLDPAEVDAAPVSGLLDLSAAEAVGLYLELKAVSPAGLRTLLDEIAQRQLADHCVIGSFRADLVALTAADGRVASSLLYHDRTADPAALVDDLGCTCIHPCFDGDDRMIGRMAGAWMERLWRRGVAIVSWNNNEAEPLARLRDVGVAGVCTDDPRVVPWR